MLVVSTARESSLRWSCVEACCAPGVAEGHTSAIIKRQDFSCKRAFKRSKLLIRIGACQILFKWPVM